MKQTAGVLALLLAGAAPALAADGAGLFAERCASCHQPDGAGAPGLAPPLRDSIGAYLDAPDGRRYLAQVPVSGLAGQIKVKGERYFGLMPSFAAALSDQEIADVLNFALVALNGRGGMPIAAADVAAARAAAPTADETRRLRDRVVPPAR